jgi:hypothetical protein
LLIAEDWPQVHINYSKAWGAEGTEMAMAYFMPVIVIGNFMLLSLFTTILLETYDQKLKEK